MAYKLSRRDFLKLSVLAMGSLSVPIYFPENQEAEFAQRILGRVATSQISLHSLPRDDARIIRQKFRDELVNIYYELTPPTGPAWNPVWYRVWGGYIHSAHVQKVVIRHNSAVGSFNVSRQLGEISVPFTQSLRFSKYAGWTSLYRLYFKTTHWVTGVIEGPDGDPWYEVTDELGDTKYYVPGHHVRLIPDEELEMISPNVPPEEKRIEVDLNRQTLTSFEADDIVLHTKIASGIYSQTSTNGLPTQTPTGTFRIVNKMPSKHMGEGRLTDNLEDYELVGVPWTAFFEPCGDAIRGYAIHGTFWHNNFGTPMSRGCINLPTDEAKWLFRWMTPVHEPTDIARNGCGIRVDVF